MAAPVLLDAPGVVEPGSGGAGLGDGRCSCRHAPRSCSPHHVRPGYDALPGGVSQLGPDGGGDDGAPHAGAVTVAGLPELSAPAAPSYCTLPDWLSPAVDVGGYRGRMATDP